MTKSGSSQKHQARALARRLHKLAGRRAAEGDRTPSTRTVLIGGTALLILFTWLQLILGLEIASTGRQIQVTTQELQAIQRQNAAIVRDIAVAQSQQNMATRAAALGYSAQSPLYLSLSQPLGITETLGSSHASAGLPALGDQGSLSQYLIDSSAHGVGAGSPSMP